MYQRSETFATEKQAMFWGLALERKIEQEGIETHVKVTHTVADLMDAHIEKLESLNKDTRNAINCFNNFRSDPLAKKLTTAVEPKDFIAWGEKYAVGRSPATVRQHLMTIQKAFRLAEVAYGISADIRIIQKAVAYLSMHGLVAQSQSRVSRMSDEDIDKVKAYYATFYDHAIPLPTIIEMLVHLPRRREELMGALWQDYDEVNHTLLLRDTKHPTRVRNELIPVPKKAQDILASLDRTDAKIFPYKGASVSAAFYRAVRVCGLDDLRLHDLRHEGISRLFEQGLSIPEVCVISGHISWDSLKRYTNLTPKNVLEKLNAHSQRTQKNTAQPERPKSSDGADTGGKDGKHKGARYRVSATQPRYDARLAKHRPEGTGSDPSLL